MALVYPVRRRFSVTVSHIASKRRKKARNGKKEPFRAGNLKFYRLQTSNAVLACDVAIVDTEAVADAAHTDGILDGIAAALHVAADIQTLNDVALGAGGVFLGEGVAVLVALQTADADQQQGGGELVGGLESDENCHTFDADRNVIPGLYVAGNVQGNRFATEYPIGLKGVSHSMAMYYGYVAGKNAMQEV